MKKALFVLLIGMLFTMVEVTISTQGSYVLTITTSNGVYKGQLNIC